MSKNICSTCKNNVNGKCKHNYDVFKHIEVHLEVNKVKSPIKCPISKYNK